MKDIIRFIRNLFIFIVFLALTNAILMFIFKPERSGFTYAFSLAGLVSAAGGLIGSVASAVSPLIGPAVSLFTNEKNRKTQKDINNKNIAFQYLVNKQNMAFQREQFQEQQYLNRNQYQLSAADMQKAGINPAMAAGGVALSSGSYSSPSEAAQANPYLIDSSPLLGFVENLMRLRSEKKIAEDSNETQKEISEAQIRADLKKHDEDLSADLKKHSENLAAENSRHSASLNLQRKVAFNAQRLKEYVENRNTRFQNVQLKDISERAFNVSIQNTRDMRELYDYIRNSGLTGLKGPLSDLAAVLSVTFNYGLDGLVQSITGSSDFSSWFDRMQKSRIDPDVLEDFISSWNEE